MTTIDILLTALAAVSAVATIVFATLDRKPPLWIVKPAATISIIVLAALRTGGGSPAVYKSFLIAGLVFSLAGDVFLIDPDRFFKAGLAAFLVAQLLYIRAFLSVARELE